MRELTTLKDDLNRALRNKKPEPFLYEVGQKVRISKWVIQDGQTPEYWGGALGQVIRRKDAGLFSSKHVYKIRLLNGNKVEEFFEYELDRRYIRKNLDKR